MFTMTIARKILGIALMLIVLMAGTSLVSTFLVIRTGERLDDIVENYIPAYGDLARTNIRSLERALALRTMIIEKLLKNADTTIYDAANARFEGAGKAAEKEAASSRALINGLLDRGVSKEDVAKLARIDIRIQVAMDKTRSQLNEEIGRLQLALDTDNPIAFQEGLARVRKGRAELNEQLESIRSDMLALLVNHAEGIKQDLRNIMIVSFALTFLAAAIGVTFSILVSGKLTQLGQTKPQSIFEPMAETGQLSLQQAELRGLYSQGLAAYRARHWQEALSLFAQALSVTPHDGPSIAMTERINKLLMTPLKDDWDGAWHFDHK